MARNVFRQRELVLAVCVSLTMAACGGGGSKSSSGGLATSPTNPTNPTNPTPPTQPSQPTDPQPPVDAQLALTNATVAQQAGFRGQGQTIGIIDSGVTRNHPALSGRVIASLNYVDPNANNLKVDDVLGHGTAVAETAAGVAFSSFAGGIAPSANIVSARIINDTEPTDDGSGQGNEVTTASPLDRINADVVAAGAHILNNSWGGIYWSDTNAAANQSFHDAYAPFTANGANLFVFAAGNDSQANPSTIAALPSRVADVEQGWLAVVALNSSSPTQLAVYSNQCGIAVKYCLAAPGDVITASTTSTASSQTYQIWEGTSLAAPQVAGAAAVVHSAFPSLDYNAVRQIILGTADDLGDPGPDAVFGYGRLNVGRAVLGPARFDWGDFSANTTGATPVFANDIAGAGGLQVSGTGTLTLAGNNSYAGLTHVMSGASLRAMHAVPGALTVENGGASRLYGDVNGTVVNAGTVATDANSVTVHGDFTQTSAGRLSQLMGAPLTVTGTATLAGTFEVAGAIPGYVNTAHQQVLTAGTRTGTFASLARASGVFLNSSLQYNGNEVWLDTTSLSVQQVANATMAQSAAATGSSVRLDGAFTQINQALAGGVASAQSLDSNMLIAAGGVQQAADTASAKASLESLSGQLYAAGTAVTLAGIDAGNDALMQHLDTLNAMDRTSRLATGGAWMQSLQSQGGLSRGGFGNVGFNVGGNMVGNDLRLGNNGFVGLAVAQMRSTGQLSGNVDRQRNRATEGSLYAGSQGANWYGVGRFGFGSFRGDTQRLLRFGDMGTSFAGGENTGHYNVAYGETGYRTHVGALDLTPFANVQYTSIRRDGFSETGGDGFGLAADGHTTSRWQAGFGLRAGRSWLTDYGKLRMDMKFGWQNAFATKGEVFSARYTGLAQWAPVDGIGLSRQAATFGLNAGLDIGARTQLAFGVDQRFASRDHSRSGMASLRVVW